MRARLESPNEEGSMNDPQGTVMEAQHSFFRLTDNIPEETW